MTATVIRADSRTLPLADNTVDLVVTSPPYFGLRSYQDGGRHYTGQVGDEATPAEFVDALLAVTRECVRVLKPTGSLWVNLGDKYAGSNGQPGGKGSSTLVGTTSHTRGMAASKRPPVTDVRSKSLIGLPWRYALRCIDDLGLILRAEVIWSKPNGLPESVTDRVRRSHETWFHLTLEPRYFSAVDEVREEHAPASLARYRQPFDVTKYDSATQHSPRPGAVDPNPLGKLPGSVWTVPTQPLQVPDWLGVDHFAAFPMEWPRRIIKGWSPSGICVECGEGRRPVAVRNSAEPDYRITATACACGSWDVLSGGRAVGDERSDAPTSIAGGGGAGTSSPSTDLTRGDPRLAPSARAAAPATSPAVVIDPFGGTGTTALVADALGRRGLSFDLSHDYSRLARWRTTDPGQRAAAMQVEKPRTELPGQADLFGEDVA